MARPTFTPDTQQAQILTSLAEATQRRAQAETEINTLLAEAERAGIPINHIAKEADITRKTVYRHLGKRMK